MPFDHPEVLIVMRPMEIAATLQEFVEGQMGEFRVPLPFDVLKIPAFQPKILSAQGKDDFDIKVLFQGVDLAQVFALADRFVRDENAMLFDTMFCFVLGGLVLQVLDKRTHLQIAVEQPLHQKVMPAAAIGGEVPLFCQRTGVLLQKRLNRSCGGSLVPDMHIQGFEHSTCLLSQMIGLLLAQD
ncbi:MAG: hypothetical protein VX083_02095 [Pseudomonadota bacterium]|nr:hypothetical protein [Pseudomonadota bacterium]MEC8041091.1 hypothetical protein [Pseudomonadota bacterium]MEC8292262.1 hypothetical protein [Pseudomonadota bacterium]